MIVRTLVSVWLSSLVEQSPCAHVLVSVIRGRLLVIDESWNTKRGHLQKTYRTITVIRTRSAESACLRPRCIGQRVSNHSTMNQGSHEFIPTNLLLFSVSDFEARDSPEPEPEDGYAPIVTKNNTAIVKPLSKGLLAIPRRFFPAGRPIHTTMTHVWR